MSRTPNEKNLSHGFVGYYPHSPDEHGGGFPCIEIDAQIYDEKQLNEAIKSLEKSRRWIAWESKGRYRTKTKGRAR